MECPEQARLRREFESALADIDRIIDDQAKAPWSTEDATMVEISIAIARRDCTAEALLHHMAEHLCGDGEPRLAGTPEAHQVGAQ